MSELKPGRELDALVAAKVMGLSVIHINREQAMELMNAPGGPSPAGKADMLSRLLVGETADGDPVPHYSTDIKAAWDAMERLADSDEIRLTRSPLALKGHRWRADIIIPGGPMFIAETAATAPHVICLAALKLDESRRSTP